MRHLVASIAIASSIAAYAHPSRVDLSTRKQVTVTTVVMGKDRGDIQGIVDQGYEVLGVDYENRTVDILTDGASDVLALRFLGLEVRGSKTIDLTAAPADGYHTAAEVEQIARNYAANYPNLVHIESFGKSGENRDLWAIKISDNPERHETDEPRIFFNAMHHAREVMTTEVTLDILDYLTTRYGSDPQVTRWVDNNEIWVVPMLNVDGNNKVWTGNSMWRKNTRDGYGVDINRNYPYAWNTCSGSSGSTWADDYRGPSPGSEPETQALMALVARIQPVFSISFHSYSELVIYPYGCQGRHAETAEVVERIGRDMASLIVRDSGRGTYTPGTPWETLYNVDGGDIDWMYNVHHVIPYVIEVNSSSQGFQPGYNWRQPTVERLRAGWQMLLERTEGSGIRGIVTDDAGNPLPQATVAVQSMNLALAGTVPTTYEVKADGTYHLVLNPGMYRLRFAVGDRSILKEVSVGAQRVEVDAQL